MITLWLMLVILTCIACGFIAWPMWQSAAYKQDQNQQTENKAWYLERLQELQQALAECKIDQATFDQDQIQLQKDFLALTETPNRKRKNKAQRLLALVVVLIFASSSFLLYQKLGASATLAEKQQAQQAAAKADAEVKAMGGEQGVIGKLKQQLASHPNQPQGWYLLGRIYFSQNNFKAATASFATAAKLAPNRADIAVQLAESAYLAQDKNAEHYLQQALKLAPEDPSALNLSALMLYHQKKYEQALAIWQNLLLQAPENSDTAKALQTAIAQTEAQLKTLPAQNSNKQIRLPVTVRIDPTLQAKIKTNDVLFVYAKALNGPAMPLAIARLSADHFPKQVVLDESMVMSPTMHLQDFKQIIIVARISHSGQAMPQPGDLEGHSTAIATNAAPAMTSITIDYQLAQS